MVFGCRLFMVKSGVFAFSFVVVRTLLFCVIPPRQPCAFHSLPGVPSSRWPNQRADLLHPISSCANVCDGFVRGGVI